MRTIVFDNLVDEKTGKLVELKVAHVDVEELLKVGERASLAGDAFRAMFQE